MQHVSKGNKTEGFVITNILGMPNTLRENIRPPALFLRGFLRRCFAIVPLRSPKRPQARRGSGNIAQLVEHSTENAGVVGSIPTVATENPFYYPVKGFFAFQGYVEGYTAALFFRCLGYCLACEHEKTIYRPCPNAGP